MEYWFDILIRASIAISLMYLLYWLLLRQSTHFRENRYFLLLSLCAAVLLSVFPLRYDVWIEAPELLKVQEQGDSFISGSRLESAKDKGSSGFPLHMAILWLYLLGMGFFLIRLLIQIINPLKLILQSDSRKIDNYYIHENKCYPLPFSLFNHIFINPSTYKQDEINDILAHEIVHIRERHWIDLFIIELLTVIFWFNPFIWFFEHAIKQNHEYLADRGVLTRGHSPVRYQALLINQLMGMKVIGLANNLNFALGPTRIKMMTKEKTPKRKLFRMIWALPVVSVLLVAFAMPEYKLNPRKGNKVETFTPSSKTKKVKLRGMVVNEDGKALQGATIVLEGTTIGTTSNKNGKFELTVPAEGEFALVASFVGYKTISNKVNILSSKSFEYEFVLKKGVIQIDSKALFLDGDVPPPPPPPAPNKLSKKDLVVVEEMPQYPNGFYGLGKHVKKQKSKIKEKLFFNGKKLEGKATVGFTVNEKGEVTNVHVLDKTNDLAADAVRSIALAMEHWSPGKQRGVAVPVNFSLELEF